MEKERAKKKRQYFQYYLAKRNEEYRSRYDHELSWKRLQQRILKRKIGRISLWCTTASAAIFLLAFGISQLLSHPTDTPDSNTIATVDISFPETGGRKAILTLGNGEKVDLTVMKGTIANDNAALISNEVNQLLTYEKKETKNQKPQINTLAVPRGGEYQLILSDGTKVWMNAESTLRYPTSFTGKTREVHLKGEAFFEVSKDARHPFIVHAEEHWVEVIGTSFNISAYPNHNIYTTLAEGKVKVSTPTASVILTPDQQAIINRDNELIETHNTPAYLYTSWTKGNYEFRNTPLKEIVAQLSRWYNVDIHFEDEYLERKRFAGIIFRNEELSFATEVIERVSNVCFVRRGEGIYIGDKKKE